MDRYYCLECGEQRTASGEVLATKLREHRACRNYQHRWGREEDFRRLRWAQKYLPKQTKEETYDD